MGSGKVVNDPDVLYIQSFRNSAELLVLIVQEQDSSHDESPIG